MWIHQSLWVMCGMRPVAGEEKKTNIKLLCCCWHSQVHLMCLCSCCSNQVQWVPGTRLGWSIFFAVQSSFRKTFVPSSFSTVSVSCVYVPSLVSRELPDFSPLLWNEICEWPGNEASVYLFSSPDPTLSRGKTVWWTKLVSTCSCSSITYSNIQNIFAQKG